MIKFKFNYQTIKKRLDDDFLFHELYGEYKIPIEKAMLEFINHIHKKEYKSLEEIYEEYPKTEDILSQATDGIFPIHDFVMELFYIIDHLHGKIKEQQDAMLSAIGDIESQIDRHETDLDDEGYEKEFPGLNEYCCKD